MSSTILRRLINANRGISRWNTWCAAKLVRRTNGGRDFAHHIVPSVLAKGHRVLDVGGGKYPRIDSETRRQFELHVTGIDISEDEMAAAPSGSYDAVIIGDVATAPLGGPYDVILSTTVLEHVADTRAAIHNMASALAPEGVMAHYMPCRNAPFARVNLLLGNKRSSRLLFSIFPEKQTASGFPAFYNLCTPRDMRKLCLDNGLVMVDEKAYFASEYLAFLAPLHTLDVLRQVSCKVFHLNELCETFMFVARRAPVASDEARQAA